MYTERTVEAGHQFATHTTRTYCKDLLGTVSRSAKLARVAWGLACMSTLPQYSALEWEGGVKIGQDGKITEAELHC